MRGGAGFKVLQGLWPGLACVTVFILSSSILTFSCEKEQDIIPGDSTEAEVIPLTPRGITKSGDYTVQVNGENMFTGLAGNNHHGYYSFCTFDFKGKVTVRVRSEETINQLEILPTALGISYEQINTNTIEFAMDEPEMITVRVNRNNKNVLHLLTSHPETDRPSPEDANVLYYAGPKEYDVGILELKDNQTLYIEGGAKLNGMILVKDAQNVKIKGRGMIDGTFNESSGNHPEGEEPWRLIYMTRSENIEIEGITLYNSLRWTIHPYTCKGIEIKNIRILNWNYGSDGTDISACQDVRIANSFYRTNDDCIAIKALSFQENAFYPNPRIQNMNVKNILVEGSTLWNMSWGNVFEIGYELRCDSVSDITFRDCDAIMQGSRGAVFSIHNADNALVENVLYEEIRVENADAAGIGRKLFDLAIFYSLFSYDSYWGDTEPNYHWDNLLSPWGNRGSGEFRGRIRNITYRNIEVLDNNFPYSIFHGFDADHQVENVAFKNIVVWTINIPGGEELKLEVNEYVENIHFN